MIILCKKKLKGEAVRNKMAQEVYKSNNDLRSFHDVIDYMVRLRRIGYLEDKAFAELMKYSAYLFIENEIDKKTNNICKDKFSPDYILGALKYSQSMRNFRRGLCDSFASQDNYLLALISF